MNKNVRNTQVAEIIAEKYLAWEWSAGAWRDNTGKVMGDYFDPMNDPVITKELAAEFGVTVSESNGVFTASLPGRNAQADSEHEAVCFVLCNAVNEFPQNW